MPYYEWSEWLFCLRSFHGTGFFLFVECQSTWGPTGKQQHTKKKKKNQQICLYKNWVGFFFFVHEQVSDMQTSTLSRNKYTRNQTLKKGDSWQLFLINVTQKYLDREYTNILQYDDLRLSPAIRTYRHWPRSLFPSGLSESVADWQKWPLGVHITPPPLVTKKGRCVEVCLLLTLFLLNIQQL